MIDEFFFARAPPDSAAGMEEPEPDRKSAAKPCGADIAAFFREAVYVVLPKRVQPAHEILLPGEEDKGNNLRAAF